jgi:tetratricopeptide (TPR) repeat protein
MYRNSRKVLIVIIFLGLAVDALLCCSTLARGEIDEKSSSGEYQYKHGKALIDQSRSLIEEAIVELEKACEDTSVALKAHQLLGEVYLMKTDFENAIFHLEYVVEKMPGDLDIRRKLALVYFKDNRLTKSLEMYEAIENEKALDPEALYYIGKIYQKKNMWDKALETFRNIKGDLEYERLVKLEMIKIESSELLTISDIRDDEIRKIIENAPSQNDYPNAGVIILLEERDMVIYENNTGVHDEHRMVKILNDRGKRYYAEVKLPFDDTYETIEVNYARTIHPDGSIIPVGKKHIKVVTPWADFPMYGNYKVMIISMPGVVQGAIIEYSATKYSMKLLNEDDFHVDAWVSGTEPKLLQKYSLTCPRNRDVKIKNLRIDVEPEVNIKDDTKTISWKIENVPVIIWESAMPNVDDIMPKIMITSFESWDEVYKCWKSLYEGKLKTDAAIIDKVEELVEGKHADAEKARAIYEYVASKIRYVGLEYGEGGMIPHRATEVFANKYGDCKDQSVLLISMMSEAGLEAYPVLIGMNKGMLHKDMPGFFQFNHCIVALKMDGKYIFLDPIVETCPYGYLSPSDQGRTAMVFSDDEFYLIDTPIYEPEDNEEHRTIEIAINEDRSIEVIKVGINLGDSGIRGREWLKRNNPISRKEFFEKEISSFCPGATLKEYTISNLDDLNVPLEITEVFTAPDYLKDIGNNLLSFHIPTVVINIRGTEKKDRVNTIHYNTTASKEYEVRVVIPKGYELDFIPEEMKLDNLYASFGYSITQVGDNEIFLKINFSRYATEVPPEDYREYKEFGDRIAQKLNEGIILKRM